jgi:hypothetical protein
MRIATALGQGYGHGHGHGATREACRLGQPGQAGGVVVPERTQGARYSPFPGATDLGTGEACGALSVAPVPAEGTVRHARPP